MMTLASACGTDDDASPSDVTTGTIDRSTSTTTTTQPEGTDPSTGGPGADDPLVGLWLALPVGITDEEGTVYAKSKAGETLRSPLDDGLGGVYYLRCVDDRPNCTIEHSISPDQVPAELGEASTLLAVGTSDSVPVLLTSWMDPSLTPSFEANVSGLVARVIDLETAKVVSTQPWFGWESGPFAADVENDIAAVCFGEGESCSLSLLAGVGGTPVTVEGVDLATVMSLALDATGQHLTWVESTPMDGAVTLHTAVVSPTGPSATDVTTVPLSEEGQPSPDDAVTDGSWVALRTGVKVAVREVGGQERDGEIKVPPGVIEMALRTPGAGGSAQSSL